MSTLTLRDIAEAAGLLALHAAHIIENDREIEPQLLFDYASCSRRRSRRWWDEFQHAEADNDPAGRRRPILDLAEELLVSELAARVGAAVFVACDARRGSPSAGPFGRHVLLDQLQAKHAVFARLLDGAQPLGALLRLNRLRRRIEHWADLLLASQGLGDSGPEFACEPDRCRQFRDESTHAESFTSRQLLLVSLRLSMPATSLDDSARADLHRSLMRLPLSLLPRHAFGVEGRLRTLWFGRICRPSVQPVHALAHRLQSRFSDPFPT